jgi:small subunit ribosomal protein S8
MVNDPIGDLLTRIRNGQERKKKTIDMPYTKLVENVLKVMVKEAFVSNYEIKNAEGKLSTITINLRYVNGQPVMDTLTRVSKPGSRRYASYQDLPMVKGGIGVQIISTPLGIMSSKEAKSKKVGGEILCEIW